MHTKQNISIAVLPFTNMSPDANNEYFCLGISEEIINTLSNIEQLNVTSRTSSFFFKDKQIPLQEIAKTLNVGIVLEGSVRFGGDKLRVSATLIDVEYDKSILSRSWERSRENIFEVQEDISISIADIIREQFGHLEYDDKIVGFPTSDIDAYDYFMKAKYHHYQFNPEQGKLAIKYYEKALECDNQLIEAYLQMADVLSFLVASGFAPKESTWAKIQGCINTAMEIDKEHPGLNYLLASTAFFSTGDFKQAKSFIQNAIDRRPKYLEAQHFMAFLYMIENDLDKAQEHLGYALTVDPLSKDTRFYESYFYYRKKDFKRSKEICLSMLDGNDKHLPCIVVLSYSLLMLGETEQLIENLNSYDNSMILEDELMGLFTLAHLYSGHPEKAVQFKEQLKDRIDVKGLNHVHIYLYLISAYEEDFDTCAMLIEKIITDQSSLLLLAFNDPLAEKFSNDKRHALLNKRIFGGQSERAQKPVKPESKLVSADKAKQIREQILDYMNAEQPYLSSTITLRTLSSMLNLSPNVLSWVINEGFEKNFNEFINQYRLEYFKKLLIDPENQHISILGLAYESGFNSKTVFNTFFKKVEGMTPKAYQKSLMNK